MKKNLISIFILITCCQLGLAQITVTTPYPVAAQPITRGLDTSKLTVEIQFTSACTNTKVTVAFPAAVTYVAGSATAIGGSTTSGFGISESNITNLSAPVFNLTVPSAGSIRFTVKRMASCGSLSNGKDTIKVNSDCGSALENDPNTNTYNIFSPSISVSGVTSINNANLGQPYTRNFTVTNGGNGCLDTLFIWVKYAPGGATLNSLKLGATTLTPTYTSGDSSYFKVFGANLPGGDNLMCNGESLVFAENVTFNKCGNNAATTYGAAWNTWDLSFCQAPTAVANVTMSNNLPSINISLLNTSTNWCPDGNYITRTLRVVNSGAGPATNLQTTWWGYALGAFYFSNSDTSNWVVKSKTGAVIGNMIRTGAMPATIGVNFYNTSCNVVTDRFNDNITMRVPNNFVIPAGDTVYIDYRVYHNNVSCPALACYPDYYGWEADDLAYTYQDQCQSGSNATSRTGLYYTSYSRAQYLAQMDPDVQANTPFDLVLTYGSLYSVVNPGTGRSYIFVKLPTDVTVNGPITSSLTGGYPSTLNSFQRNDTLFIDMLENTFVSGGVKIPLIATCGTGGNKPFKIGHLHWWDSTACPNYVLSLACLNMNTNLHCPGCTGGGATPLNFHLKRTTYGFPDANNDNIPDAFTGTPNLSLLNLKNALNGDSVLGTWNIKVYNNATPGDPKNGQPFTNVYLDYSLFPVDAAGLASGQLNHPYTYNPAAAADVVIYPAGGGAPINCTAPYTIVNNIAHYDFSSCKASWNAGDSIVVNAKFVVSGYLSTSGHNLAYTVAHVYSTYAPRATPTLSQITLTTYTCDYFQNYMDILNAYATSYNYPSYLNGCTDRTIYYGSEFGIVDNGYPVKFPYEARIISTPDTAVLRLPPGFTYEPNSAQINSSPAVGFLSVPSSMVQVSGDIVKLVGLKSLFKQYGGSYDLQAEYDINNYYIRVIPTCTAQAGLAGTRTHEIITAGNGLNSPSDYHQIYPWGGHYANDSLWDVTQVYYNPPQPVFSGGGTVQSFDGTGTWNVVLQNASNSVAADNAWFYISPVNGLTNIVVMEGATTIAPDANGFYHLNSLVASANRNFTITAKTNSCSVDSMRITQGYDCVAYPTSFALQSCTNSVWLKIDNYPSQVQLAMVRQPGGGYSTTMCDVDSTTFVINSAQAANLVNPYVTIYPPAGVTISTPFPVEYPLNSGNWYSITPTVLPGGYKIDFSNILAIASTGLPGTVTNPGANARQAKVKVTYSTDCSIVSGTPFNIFAFGQRPCGQPAIDNGTTLQSTGINIAGAIVPGSMGITLKNLPATMSCGQSATINFSDIVVGTPTQSGDTVIYTLPVGLSYNGGYSGIYNCASCSVSTGSGLGGTTLVKVALQPGVAANDSLKYSFNVIASGLGGCSTGNSIYGSAKRNISGLTCGATTCTTSSVVIGSSTSSSTILQKPSPVITNMAVVSGQGGTWNSGQTPTVAITIRNDGTLDMPASSYYIEFFCGSNTSPIATVLFPPAVAVGQTVTANVSFTLNSSCSNGNLITGKIRANSVIGAPQCICAEASFTISQALPISLVSFTASEANCRVNLAWKSGVESGGDRFVVEASTDGKNFKAETSVSAKGSNSQYQYSATNAGQQVTYYRLRMVNNDGSEAFSNTIAVRVYCTGKTVIIYPNPADAYVNISIAGFDGKTNAKLFNSVGTKVGSLELVAGINKVATNGLPSGIYHIVITDSKGEVQTFKVQVIRGN